MTVRDPLAAGPEPADVPRSVVTLLATGAGLSVAGLYYNQPLLHTIADELHASPRGIALVPMLTQLGYAAGILLFAPLGDRLERRGVILAKSLALAVALAAAAHAPGLATLATASLAIGLLATIAQDFVPAAAAIAPARSRGAVVGRVMSGLLLGILLSRVVSGSVGERFGWRVVFDGAAVSVALLAVVARVGLPTFPPTTTQRYWPLLSSMARLTRDNPSLQRAALAQSLLSLAFSGFWSTLALALAAPPFHLGSTVAGAFGLAGAAGALAAPVAGSLADARGPESVIRLGASLVLASFVAMALAPGSLVVLVLATITFDLGAQACLISHQTIVYGLDPAARSRLNAVLVSSMFVGMSIGAAIASAAFARYGFRGVALVGAAAALGALLVRLWPRGGVSSAAS